jgi:hypothetical protein
MAFSTALLLLEVVRYLATGYGSFGYAALLTAGVCFF